MEVSQFTLYADITWHMDMHTKVGPSALGMLALVNLLVDFPVPFGRKITEREGERESGEGKREREEGGKEEERGEGRKKKRKRRRERETESETCNHSICHLTPLIHTHVLCKSCVCSKFML